MYSNEPYTASLTGQPFLFSEMRTVARMRIDGMTDDEIAAKVWDENLFQCNGRKGVRRTMNAVLLRLNTLDGTLLSLVAEGLADVAKVAAVYSIMKTSRLFREFMYHVYMPNARLSDGRVDRTDVDAFFRMLQEQDEAVVSWSPSTVQKLQQVIVKILADAGLINNTQDRLILRPILSFELRSAIEAVGDGVYLEILTGGDMAK
ncbi:MAG: DUF1819 family protein [Firmicutes bacterium]|jgi:hypothetical protein|nr:DUF1819 family protein [Bacillota bacterium]